MRISDWSSDVCSSDLPALLIEGEEEVPRGLPDFLRQRGGRGRADISFRKPAAPDDRVAVVEHGADPAFGHILAAQDAAEDLRSEERRVGKECVSTCRSRWSPDHEKKNNICI